MPSGRRLRGLGMRLRRNSRVQSARPPAARSPGACGRGLRRHDRARHGALRRRHRAEVAQGAPARRLPQISRVAHLGAGRGAGVIIGEYVGGESGLGIAMIAVQAGLKVDTTWGIALVAAGLAGVAYGITAC